MNKVCCLTVFLLAMMSTSVFGQNYSLLQDLSGRLAFKEVILPAFSSLDVQTDTRTMGLANTHIALSPQGTDVLYNTAKTPFSDTKMGVGMQWMHNDEISMFEGHYFAKIKPKHSIIAGFAYNTYAYYPLLCHYCRSLAYREVHDYVIQLGYAYQWNPKWSAGVSLKYAHTDPLFEHEGITRVVADLSIYHRRPLSWGKGASHWAWGATLSNLGRKVSYDHGITEHFLPITLGVGNALQWGFQSNQQLTFALDLYKLLIPLAAHHISGQAYQGSDLAVWKGIFTSFVDAPGGFKEELQEWRFSMGMEYKIKKIAFRAGYFHEAETKGARQFLAFGAGTSVWKLHFNFAFLVPTIHYSLLDQQFALGIQAQF